MDIRDVAHAASPALPTFDDATSARFLFELLPEKLSLLVAEVVAVLVDPDSFFDGDFGGREEAVYYFGVFGEF